MPTSNAPSESTLNAPSDDGLRYRVFSRVWALGALAHLTLPDALQTAWLVPDLLLLGGAGLLAFRPTIGAAHQKVGWALSALGLAWPLLWLGDQLSQSGYMLLTCVAGLAYVRREQDLMKAVRLLTAGVYAIAVFHKLNADFFNAEVSCATGGMRLLAQNWGLPEAPGALDSFWPLLFIATESTLVFLFFWRPRFALLLAAAMHIPLTIVFAPSFAWVMAPGWVCFLEEREIALLLAFVRKRRWRILGVGAALAALSAALYFQDHWIAYPSWQLKEAALWIVFVALVSFEWRGPRRGREVHKESRAWTPWLFVAVFVLNAMTPYLGLQFHHAGAMLSNLRIDEGCWNHLLMPEAMRWSDPYIRVQHVSVPGDVEGSAALEALIEERLWHPAHMKSAMQGYCSQGASPIELSFSYQGQSRHLEDACGGLELPDQPIGLFQTNLERHCPQRCVH